MSARRALAAACVVLALHAAPARAETRWISDVLTVPLRSGPSNGHRILHRGLPSGTALEVTAAAEQNGFLPVRTENGTEGWIETQYLVAEPIARARLAAAERRVASLERQLADRTRSVSELSSQRLTVAADREALATEVASLESQLAELRSMSAGAIATHEVNEELERLNARLRAEVDALSAEVADLQAAGHRRGMWLGAGLVIAGFLLGAFLKSRPRRSGWS